MKFIKKKINFKYKNLKNMTKIFSLYTNILLKLKWILQHLILNQSKEKQNSFGQDFIHRDQIISY
jgi:hypothetical protein